MIKFSLFLHVDMMIIIGVRLKFEFLTKISKTLFIPDFPSISPEFLSWWYYLKMFFYSFGVSFSLTFQMQNLQGTSMTSASASNYNFDFWFCLQKTKQLSTPSDGVFWLAKQLSMSIMFTNQFSPFELEQNQA